MKSIGIQCFGVVNTHDVVNPDGFGVLEDLVGGRAANSKGRDFSTRRFLVPKRRFNGKFVVRAHDHLHC